VEQWGNIYAAELNSYYASISTDQTYEEVDEKTTANPQNGDYKRNPDLPYWTT